MKKVSFSIITPTYNRASTGLLQECIENVQAQIGDNFTYEHLIVNDGSDDDTVGIVSEYSREDARIKLFTQKNSGTAQSLRRGTLEASGDYIVILSDDDLLPLDSLKLRSDYILKNPSTDWFYGKTQWIDAVGKNVKTWTQSIPVPEFPYERMLAENFIQGGTITIRTKIYDNLPWPKWLKKSDDYFVAMELLRPENGYKYGFLDSVLYKYRRHNLGMGMQSGRSLKDAEAAEKRWELDNKIRKLHTPGLAYLSSELNKAWRENRQLSHEVDELTGQRAFLEREIKSKNDYIARITGSLGWKLLEVLRLPLNLIKGIWRRINDAR